MGSIWKENQKRTSRKSITSASDDHDLIRIEDQVNITTNASGIGGVAVVGTPTLNDVLKYDGTNWVPTVDASGSGGSNGLDAVLAILNATSGNNIVVDTGDQLFLPNGTAGAPSLAFSSNPTTGITQSGDTLNAVTAGVLRAAFSSQGLVFGTGASLGISFGTTPKEIVSYKSTVEASTAGAGSPNVILANETPRVFHNEGSTVTNNHNLPAAAAGLRFTFIVQDADGLRVNITSGDTIRIANLVSSAGGAAESSTIGDVLDLVAINVTEWISLSPSGSWVLT